jgi:hypothetical protein
MALVVRECPILPDGGNLMPPSISSKLSPMTRIEIPNSSARRGRRGLRLLVISLLVIIAGVALWTWLTLSWAYSDGERAGVLQKFSRKGWICKTQEGEIAMYFGGQVLTSPQMWQFSVRDKNVAAQLDKAVGHRVQLHYTEHPGMLSDCFADTRYFVDRVTITDEAEGGALPALAAPQQQTPDVRPGATLPAPPRPASAP